MRSYIQLRGFAVPRIGEEGNNGLTQHCPPCRGPTGTRILSQALLKLVLASKGECSNNVGDGNQDDQMDSV